jgi:hypothetical protein
LEGLIKTEVARLEGQIARLEGVIGKEIARLEGEIKNMKVTRDRKFTIMFLIILISNILLNQNSLKFIAELLGIVKP